MPLLREHQAWSAIAHAYNFARLYGPSALPQPEGLCARISDLYRYGLITARTAFLMRTHLVPLSIRTKGSGTLIWAPGFAGLADRLEAAQMLAENTQKRKRKKCRNTCQITT
jgi:hypothetical protein